MIYQVFNIVDIEESKNSKTFKIIVIILAAIVEIANIVIFIKSIGTDNFSISNFLFNIFLYLICAYMVILQSEGDRKEIVILNIQLNENEIILTYPNRYLKRNADPYIINIPWRDIDKIEYDENTGVLQIKYFNEDFEENNEIIYLQEDNKEKIFRDIIKHKKKYNN